MVSLPRVVITGVGLASPNGASLAEFRANLLAGRSGAVLVLAGSAAGVIVLQTPVRRP